jgi:hypothetical protein
MSVLWAETDYDLSSVTSCRWISWNSTTFHDFPNVLYIVFLLPNYPPFMEPGSLLPNLQDRASEPSPVPFESAVHITRPVSVRSMYCCLPAYSWVLKYVLPLTFFDYISALNVFIIFRHAIFQCKISSFFFFLILRWFINISVAYSCVSCSVFFPWILSWNVIYWMQNCVWEP